jgi:hypothetical protein
MPPFRQVTSKISALTAARALQFQRSHRFHQLAAQIGRRALAARARKRPRQADVLLQKSFWHKEIAVRAAVRARALTRQIRRLRTLHAANLVRTRLRQRRAAQGWRRAARPAARQRPRRPLQQMAPAQRPAAATPGRRPLARRYAEQLRPNQPVRCNLVHRARVARR